MNHSNDVHSISAMQKDAERNSYPSNLSREVIMFINNQKTVFTIGKAFLKQAGQLASPEEKTVH